MSELSKLKHRLSAHRRQMREFPPESQVEKRERELEGRLLQVQLEAEELRHSIRISLPFCESYAVRDENGITAYKFMFGWEPVRDAFFKAVYENEARMIALINSKIKAINEKTGDSPKD